MRNEDAAKNTASLGARISQEIFFVNYKFMNWVIVFKVPWISQLGSIDPSAFFSLIKAIRIAVSIGYNNSTIPCAKVM